MQNSKHAHTHTHALTQRMDEAVVFLVLNEKSFLGIPIMAQG